MASTERSQLLHELHIDRTEAPHSRKGLWITLSVLIVVIAGALIAWKTQPPPSPVVHVATAKNISANTSASVLDATGYVTARRMATVSSKITGKVLEVFIEEGQHVDAGQIMATLDPIDAQAQRQLARSQVAASHSELDSIKTQLKQAEVDAARYQELHTRKLAADERVEQVIAQRDTLKAQLETAERNLQVAMDQLHITENGVDSTIVRAPFAGVITAKAAQPGEIVSPLSAGGGFTRTGIGTLVDMDSLEVEVDVNEAYIGRVQPKMPVDAVLNAYPEWHIPAEVVAAIPAANRSKATVKVRIALKIKDPRIVPDMGVKVSFLEASKTVDADALTGVGIPASAIISSGDSSICYVLVEQSRVERRAIKTGRIMGSERQILAGLSAGESVVTDPSPTLADGIRVQLASDNADVH